jgi:hypothetical protein
LGVEHLWQALRNAKLLFPQLGHIQSPGLPPPPAGNSKGQDAGESKHMLMQWYHVLVLQRSTHTQQFSYRGHRHRRHSHHHHHPWSFKNRHGGSQATRHGNETLKL